MKARLDELNKNKFLPDRGSPDKQSCDRWDGFYGPWIDVPEMPTEVGSAEQIIV